MAADSASIDHGDPVASGLAARAENDPAIIASPPEASLPALMQLITPDRPGATSVRDDIWAAEAIHRANNLTQLVDAAVSVSKRRSWVVTADMQLSAGALRDLYADLANVADPKITKPCGEPAGDLAKHLVTLFGPTVGVVGVSLSIAAFSMPSPQRRAVLLIVSELVINALRHAFRDRPGGSIGLTLSCEGSGATLIVADDGCGFATRRKGLGSALVMGLADFLGGRVAVKSAVERGTEIVVEFPLVVAAPSPRQRCDGWDLIDATIATTSNEDQADVAG